MEQYISKDVLVAEIEHHLQFIPEHTNAFIEGEEHAYRTILSFIDTLEVKEVNEVPATVMVNKYGNRFISSWAGLKEYDNFKEGEEIKIVIPKKVNL